MVYYTGDIHGSGHQIMRFCNRMKLTASDIVVILGDVGANYSLDQRDRELKAELNRLEPTILCIHGNHEIRPQNIPSYREKEWNGGTVWYEEEYPHLLFAKDGDVYWLEGVAHLVIGGAYSVDKFYRLAHGYGWWEDEQPSTAIKEHVEEILEQCGWAVDTVLTHTCPLKYEPVEAFLPMIDQSTVDNSTEAWLDEIEKRLSYKRWYCGHWHIDKRIDKIHFLFHTFEAMEPMEVPDRM